MNKYTLALMPTGQMEGEVIRASSFLAQGSQYIMEERAAVAEAGVDSVFSLVHATLIQFKADDDTARALWNAAFGYMNSNGVPMLKPKNVEVMPRGEFCNVFWHLVQEEGLMQLHSHLLDFLGDVDVEPSGLVGDAYEPHFTVARHKAGYEIPASFPLPEEGLGYDSLKLVLGSRGPNGQLQEIYASAEF